MRHSTGRVASVRYALGIAWGNTFQNRLRTAAALAGIIFSLLLILVQLGFLRAAESMVTSLFDLFEFDAVIVDARYQIIATAPEFDRRRLVQAGVDPAVIDSFRLNIDSDRWVDEATEIESSVLLIGLDDKPQFLRAQALREGAERLVDGRSVVLDSRSHADYGSRETGQRAKVRGLAVEVVSRFELGLFFYAEGALATSNANFTRLSGRPVDEVTLGLLKFAPGTDAEQAAARISRLLPDDVVVLTREQLYRDERGYFVDVKPIGIMFETAVFVAFVVGLVILYQVLATELGNRMHEYATMKAMGFGVAFIYGIGVFQSLLFIVLSYLPAIGLATALFDFVNTAVQLPTRMTPQLALLVFSLTVVMGTIAGVVALRKLRSADPVELFG